MKKNTIFTLSTLLLLASCGGGGASSSSTPTTINVPPEDNKVHLIILTGQSGARGKAVNSDLLDEQKEINDEVDIMADGLTMPALSKIPETISSRVEISELKPGYGDSGNEFGPELGMGETMRSRYLKDGDLRKSVIVKYTACGSTFTDHWYSESLLEDEELSSKLNLAQVRTNEKTQKQTGPLTNNLYQLIDATIQQLSDEGFESVIDGAVFLHGEQDAKFDVNMEIYEKALEYFIQDLRSYVDNETLPFVISEALTNSAKYSNRLREIQKTVADRVDNATFVSNEGLYTNTFEPWHFGAQSNMELGNRLAAEVISHYDYRKVKTFEDKTITVPQGVKVSLPTYIKATFENDMEGMIKIAYTSDYDETKLGEQTISFKATTVYGDFNGTLKVIVNNEPYIDGQLTEYANMKKHTVDGIGDIYVAQGKEGLYIAAKVNDNDLWTDGEAWSVGDMGQKGLNDDFRIFVASTDDAENRVTVCLSAANLLRVYEAGTTLEDKGLEKKNLVYQDSLEDYRYRVTTKGLTNVEEGGASNGFDLELYISYSDLGIDPEDMFLCFDYNNITKTSGTKTATDHYFSKTNQANSELDIANYFSLTELI
ncbi:MAG: hypothetical protein KH380_03860 [Coprobacillus sp.]|nr:hypothetical protein [Coprobacillus sp.]